jgi:GNAT superfamily N-acetyltransferase
MDSVTVRRVVPEDFEDICLLSNELGYSYPAEKMRERIQYILDHTKDIILVAESGGKAVGYIHGSPYELMYHDSIMNILGFVVEEERRGAGIGHRLISELEKMAKGCGFTGMRLTSGSYRIDAHRFYEKHGYMSNKISKKFTKNFNEISY